MIYKNSENIPLKVGFITIGCRANQADTARMISLMPANAVEADPMSDQCDIAIINTCTVTSRAEADGRKMIRRIKRNQDDVKILVTGCAVQVDKNPWSEMPEVDLVIGIKDRDDIRKFIRKNLAVIEPEIKPPSGGVDGPTPLKGHKSRPFLKFQDGCTRGCSYCIVPKARGPERSRPLDLISEDISKLHDFGYNEIVLTGVHLGRWGYDIGSDITDLIEMLDKIDLDIRFRFSSLEPMDLTPEIIERVIGHPKICPHLHLPLQSGDQKILDLMGRGHSLDDYTRLLEAAIKSNPDTALGTDIMIGFTGEDDESFLNTLNYLREIPLTYMHIFTYSPRSGTRAAEMPGKPHGKAVRNRLDALKHLDKEKRKAFYQSQDGKIRPFLIENPRFKSGRITALSDNYLRVVLNNGNDDNKPGQVIPLRLDINNASLLALPEF